MWVSMAGPSVWGGWPDSVRVCGVLWLGLGARWSLCSHCVGEGLQHRGGGECAVVDVGVDRV